MRDVMPRSLDITRRRRAAPPHIKSRSRSRTRGRSWFVMGLILVGILYIGFEGQRSGQLFTLNTGSPTSVTPTTTGPALVIPSFETQGPPLRTDNVIVPTSAPPPETTITPSPTPTPTPDKKNISISVLNGSGRAGEGNRVRLQLIDQGFTIRRLAVAPKVLASTTLYYQPGKTAEAALVAGHLTDYQITLEENQAQTSPDDVVIIVGENILVE